MATKKNTNNLSTAIASLLESNDDNYYLSKIKIDNITAELKDTYARTLKDGISVEDGKSIDNVKDNGFYHQVGDWSGTLPSTYSGDWHYSNLLAFNCGVDVTVQLLFHYKKSVFAIRTGRGESTIWQDWVVYNAPNDVGSIIDILDNKLHNTLIVRGKDITAYYQDGSLWTRITNNFDDIYVGDYFAMSQPITNQMGTGDASITGTQYVTIASLNEYLTKSDVPLTFNHITCVPGMFENPFQSFGSARYNPANQNTSGYANSEIASTVLGPVTSTGKRGSNATINEQLYSEFGSHLKTFRELLTISLNTNGYNRLGSTEMGCSNGYAWYDVQSVLLSEIEVYGSIVWSSSGYDTGIANKQLPLFAQSPKSATINGSGNYWLKDIVGVNSSAYAVDTGTARYYDVGRLVGRVRPKFVLGA